MAEQSTNVALQTRNRIVLCNSDMICLATKRTVSWRADSLGRLLRTGGDTIDGSSMTRVKDSIT